MPQFLRPNSLRTGWRSLPAMMAACGLMSVSGAANAALLELSGGVWQMTSSSNDVITDPAHFWDNATITTTAPVLLTFYYVGAESGFTNTLNLPGAGTHAEDDSFPGSWSNPALFSVTLGANEALPLSFTSNGFGSMLAPGAGESLGGDQFSRSIGFAFLDCTNSMTCFTHDPSLRTGNILAFLLDDGGAGVDNDHDDYVGYVVASAPVPLPAAGWLLLSGVGVLGVMRKRNT